MARKSKIRKVTSLWKVVEAMQARLEGEGLDAEVIDAAVTRGLEELLSCDYGRPSRRRLTVARPLQLLNRWPAKA